MGRTLKRVPMDFDWPLNKIWYGYYSSFCHCDGLKSGECDNCKRFAMLKGIEITSYGCPDFEQYIGPPRGEGFQLWKTTSEGSPTSPVFATLDELCEWCEDNETVFSDIKATKEEWEKMLQEDLVLAEVGNAIFM